MPKNIESAGGIYIMANIANINNFVLQQSIEAAAKLWTYGSASYPIANGAIIQSQIEQLVTDTAIVFAIHVRRLLDNLNIRDNFPLNEPFYIWSPLHGLHKADFLRDSLNCIIHATEFEVGFERLPKTNIIGGAVGVIYLKTKTDRREEALIDVFALASCFFHVLLPKVNAMNT